MDAGRFEPIAIVGGRVLGDGGPPEMAPLIIDDSRRREGAVAVEREPMPRPGVRLPPDAGRAVFAAGPFDHGLAAARFGEAWP